MAKSFNTPIKAVEMFDGWALVDAQDKPIAACMNHGRDMGESDAKHIVECVNNFEQLQADKDEMFSVLRSVYNFYTMRMTDRNPDPNSPYAKVKALVEKHDKQ